MNTKILLSAVIACNAMMPATRIQAEVSPWVAGITTISAVTCGIWAYHERVAKNKAQVDLDDRNALTVFGEHAKNLEYNYGHFFTLFKNTALTEKERLNLYINFMQPLLTNRESVRLFRDKLSQDVQKAVQLLSQAGLMIVKLKQHKIREGELAYLEQVLVPELKQMSVMLNALYLFTKDYYNSLQLIILVNAYEQKYIPEKSLDYVAQNFVNAEKLYEHIKINYNKMPFQFPFINYIESLKQDIRELEHVYALVKSENKTQTDMTQIKEKLDRAEYLLSTLDNVLKFITKTPFYVQEIKQKPEFDRQEELLRIELQERKAKIEREKQVTEAQLQHERNKAQELANSARDVEWKIKEIARQKEAAILEESRIQDGKNIQEAVTKQNAEWEAKYSNLAQQHKSQLSNIIQQYNSVINSTKQATAALTELNSKLTRVPYNPNTVPWLPAYLQDLKKHAEKVTNSLQIEGLRYEPLTEQAGKAK
jgi:hypothetical protein